jgi:hypothetical protein
MKTKSGSEQKMNSSPLYELLCTERFPSVPPLHQGVNQSSVGSLVSDLRSGYLQLFDH